MKKRWFLTNHRHLFACGGKFLKIMKITIFIVVFASMQTFALDNYAQTKRMDVKIEESGIVAALEIIEAQSEFFFFYNNKVVKLDKIVSVDLKHKTINEILDAVFKDTDIEYTINNRQIILSGKEAGSTVSQQQKSISGKVTDSSGGTLPGVTVVVKGTTNGTITDANGKYSLSNIPENATLQFSFIGMKSQEIAVDKKTTINLTLDEETIGIEEVVAIGYGSMKKSDLTGALSSIKSEEISKMPIVSLEQGLQGRAAGVKVEQTSGEPGGNVSIRIRGGNSINAGNEPLFVIDGFVGVGDLNDINPQDIESIEVLKDASATAIYGARGSNGVVLITTNRGKTGKPTFQFGSYYGFQKIVKKIAVMNGREFAEMANEGAINNKQPLFYPNPEEIGKGTDWQEEILQDAPIQDYHLSTSGGTDAIRYAVSGDYFDQKGIVLNSGYNRYSFRTNLDLNLTSKFKMGTNIMFSRSLKHISNETGADDDNPITNALFLSPADPVYNADGTYNFKSPISEGYMHNPLAIINGTINNQYKTRILGSIFLEYKLMNNLVLKSSFGVDINNYKNDYYAGKSISPVSKGYASIYRSDGTTWLNENTINYDININNIHKINILGGFTIQKSLTEFTQAARQNFASDLISYNRLNSGSEEVIPTSGGNGWQLESYLGRINYIMADKYLFTVTGRIDGSSKFGAGNKYAFFPSVAFSWKLWKEEFIKRSGWFDDLKLRLTYGLSGSQDIPPYRSLATMSSNPYPFGVNNTIGFYQNRLANPNLKWETTAQADLGIDVGILNNRLRITADYYYKKTTDLLLAKSIPSTSGFSTSFENSGSLENKGYEVGVGADVLSGKFKWTTDFNISGNKNKVLSLGGVDFFYAGSSVGSLKLLDPGIVRVGEEIGQFFGYRTDGIYQNQQEIVAGAEKGAKPGQIRIKDTNLDGVINTVDRVVLGSANPDFFFGFNNIFSYKNFELSVFLQGSYGNEIMNFNHFSLAFPSSSHNCYSYVVNRWKGEGTSNEIPQIGSVQTNYLMDKMVEDGSYVKLKNITLSYKIPRDLLKRMNIQSAKVYVSSSNLITLTNYSGFDPEVNKDGDANLQVGGDYNAFPSSKMYLMGISITF